METEEYLAQLLESWQVKRKEAAQAEKAVKEDKAQFTHTLHTGHAPVAARQLHGGHVKLATKVASFESVTRACVRALDTLIKERTNAQTVGSSQSAAINALPTDLPVWPILKHVPLCGAFPALEGDDIVPGQEVAALVEDEWILSVVVDANKSTYSVEDILHPGTDKWHELPRARLIPLPRWAPRVDFTMAHFEVGDIVLAMYPQTTCFYKAVVNRPPTQETPTYSLQFEDDNFGDGRIRYHEIAVKFVLNFPL
ncbi:hypothetical protein PTSG_06410 [Salpingoeca rosetta]|uniref:SGF29 C-terminal domain-containing protein n=1 Tax=Salpingoeca rosetta (strain ATCC 50818 / BSB-021) TaxID=946362 RepID=F2UBY4_SALR5|nr:uncharacterized protein PTSG_06410 [Salpingoeca rosetta]EGD74399.1 hypothetical protein PTSG_06410 [Salpingoeca rosetta]|eukprot:XP_004993299.1 hypothetical protein PTSG_06410 [Salpingoeca rosetta]